MRAIAEGADAIRPPLTDLEAIVSEDAVVNLAVGWVDFIAAERLTSAENATHDVFESGIVGYFSWWWWWE